MSTESEPELTETQKAYNVAQYEIFQLAAYGHCTYTPRAELLTAEGKAQQADYNNRIRKAREELEAAVLRLVAEHAETFQGDWGVPANWLRAVASDPKYLSLMAVRPEERDPDAVPAAAPAAVPPTDRAGLRELIAGLFRHPPGVERLGDATPGEIADAVLALLFGPIPAGTDTATWTAIRAIQLMNEAGQERDASAEPHRLALSTALGLGTSAPWDAIRERAAELAGQDVAGDRGAAVWLDAAAECNKAGGAHAGRGDTGAASAAFALMEKFLMEAGKAEYVATPCSAPDYCEDGGEPCSVHERLMGHAEGDHELCAPDCGAEWLRRLAAETPGPETQGEAHPPETCWQVETQWRSGDWHSWALRTEHDDALAEFERAKDSKSAWRLVRFHTTTAVEAEHTPDTEMQDTPPVEPHPTEADLRHALTVLDKFEGRDGAAPVEAAASRTTKYRHTCHDQTSAPGRDWECQWCSTLPESLPAVVAEPGKENGRG